MVKMKLKVIMIGNIDRSFIQIQRIMMKKIHRKTKDHHFLVDSSNQEKKKKKTKIKEDFSQASLERAVFLALIEDAEFHNIKICQNKF